MSVAALTRVAWSDEGGAAGAALRTALLPASALFRAASRAHHRLYDAGVRSAARAPIPVISVGNLRVGGAGKTPFTGWVVDRLIAAGRRPAVLHGGYGSDEPALHRRWHPDVPVLVGRERIDSARAAAEQGRDVVVLDDGFQHRRLARDLDIVLLAAEHGVDRIHLLPRGPWREPLVALRRAHVVIVTRKTATRADADEVVRYLRETIERRAHPVHIEAGAWRRLDGSAVDAPATPVRALASTAEPESFFATVESMGHPLASRHAYPDHHDYDEDDVKRIVRSAQEGTLVTTEKDAVKLEPLLEESGTDPVDIRVLTQRVVIEDGEAELNDRIMAAAERR